MLYHQGAQGCSCRVPIYGDQPMKLSSCSAMVLNINRGDAANIQVKDAMRYGNGKARLLDYLHHIEPRYGPLAVASARRGVEDFADL